LFLREASTEAVGR